MPYFEGLQDETIKQGSVFDLTEGVRAFDGDDQEITYTYSPTNDEFDTCAVGSHTIQYHASQTVDKMLPNMCISGGLALTTPRYCDDYESATAKRIIRIIQASAPQILGIPHVTIAKNTTLDVLNGVSAVDDNGNPITDISYSGTLDKQVSGDIASITDGQNIVPVKSLKVTLEPIQSGSGTPSPDNVRPISGHTEVDTEVCGVNVWDEEWEVGGIDPSTGQPYTATDRIRSKNFIPILADTDYYYKAGASGQTAWQLTLGYYDANKDFISIAYVRNGARHSPTNAKYARFMTTSGYGTTYNNDISINYPSTDHDYHAYQGNTYTTTLGRTVYGGTLDVVTGELVVDRAMDVFTGDSVTRIDTLGGVPFARVLASKYVTQEGAWVDVRNSIKCNAYVPSDVSASGNIQWAVRMNQKVVRILDDRFTDLETAKAILDAQPAQYCYPISTPQTIQLTPQQVMLLHGNNNVWSDGEVTVVYSLEIPTDGEVSYPLEGEYEITYSATDKCGNVGEAIRQITVE